MDIKKMHKKTKILLINPPQTLGVKETLPRIKIPLGFLYIAGYLEKNGFKTKIIDAPVFYKLRRKLNKNFVRIGLFPEEIINQVEAFNPDIIGVSCAFTMYESDSFDLIKVLRKRFPEKIIVVGGAHSSANPEFVLRNKDIDLVIIGEGEITMLELARRVEQGKNLKNIPGTARIIKDQVVINPSRKFIENLDDLPAAWNLINLNEYFQHPDNSIATMRKNSVDMITSRGCPGNCVFCSIKTVWGRKWRARTPKNVVDEIEMLVKMYGAKQFRFQDDNLTLDKKRIIQICDEILRRELDIRWDTPNGIALWTLDKEILLKMKKSGCYRVTFGVESASKRTQKYIGKVIDLNHIREMTNFCHKIGLWVCATFIIGFPEETEEEIMETENFILSSKINFPFIYIAQPYQGTRMYEDFKKLGLLKDSFKVGSNIKETQYNTLHFTQEELNNRLAVLYKKFYFKKIISYLNPITLYLEILSKIKSTEDLKYFIKMFRTASFK